MSALESKIDELYRLPLAEFTAARNALARSIGGADGKRIKALAKPTVVPWAVNQVYWHARAVFDRVLKTGQALRKAQIASLEGKRADLHAAGDAHRHAIADAVKSAEKLAGASTIATDAVARTFEALSLAPEPSGHLGRLTEALQPPGFEALAGVTVKEIDESNRAGRAHRPAPTIGVGATIGTGPTTRPDPRRERAERDAARKREAALKEAESALARVEAAEQKARAAWERAHDALLDARKTVAGLKSQV